MELSQILDSLSSGGTEKVASMSQQSASLENALSRALEASDNVKTASVTRRSPSSDLESMAVKLANAEQEALIKEAELYGAAVADGFIARMGSSGSSMNKVASYYDEGSSDDLLVKEAMELGYSETKMQLEKIAEEAFAAGYNDTLVSMSSNNQLTKQASFNKMAAAVKVAADLTARDGYRLGLKIISSIPGRV